jgi:hypothetical protein
MNVASPVVHPTEPGRRTYAPLIKTDQDHPLNFEVLKVSSRGALEVSIKNQQVSGGNMPSSCVHKH